MPTKQQRKGRSFERNIAQFLTEYFGDTFLRTIGSGAELGGKNAVKREYMTTEQARSKNGDIYCPSQYQNFVVECKHVKEFAFHQLFTTCPKLNDWIDQLETSLEDSGDVPIIFFKVDYKGTYCAVPHSPRLVVGGQMMVYRGYAITELYNMFNEHNHDLFKRMANIAVTDDNRDFTQAELEHLFTDFDENCDLEMMSYHVLGSENTEELFDIMRKKPDASPHPHRI